MKRRANQSDIIRKHREQFRGGSGGISHFTSLAEIQVEPGIIAAIHFLSIIFKSEEIGVRDDQWISPSHVYINIEYSAVSRVGVRLPQLRERVRKI